jgi:hypothetical protein
VGEEVVVVERDVDGLSTIQLVGQLASSLSSSKAEDVCYSRLAIQKTGNNFLWDE